MKVINVKECAGAYVIQMAEYNDKHAAMHGVQYE